MAESRFDWWLSSPFHVIAGAGGIVAQGVSEITLEAYPVTTQMTNPRFKEPAAIEPVPLTQTEFLSLEIDNPNIRWHPVTEPPAEPMDVILLVDDETFIGGKWNGTRFEYPSHVKSEPSKWRPEIRAKAVILGG